MDELAKLIMELVINTVRESMRPVGIQNGIYQEDKGEIKLDQQLNVEFVNLESFNREYEIEVTDGELTATVEGKIPGDIKLSNIKGKLKIIRPIKDGDKLKVLKEDGEDKYFILDKL